MKSIGVALFLCAIIASFGSIQCTSSIKIEVFAGSNPWWIAVAIHDADTAARAVQIRDSRFSWEPMDYTDSWGYFTYSARGFEFDFPISFRIFSATGEQIQVNNAVYLVNGATQMVDTGVQFSGIEDTPPDDTPDEEAPPEDNDEENPPEDNTPVAPEPSKAATTRPITPEATKAPTTTSTTTTTTSTTTTTKAPTTSTTTTTTKAPTTSTTTTTTTTTKAPVANGCAGPTKIMIPLYVYPGAAWDKIIASASKAPAVAIINPASGPGNGPNADYVKYMDKMHAAGVEMIGYVYTNWGNRDINVVKADINKYALNFPYVVGIFLDEGATEANKVWYYKELYTYIMGLPGYKYDVINPGTIPDAGYMDTATQIVTLENYASEIVHHRAPSYGSCANKDKFVAIVHTASLASMPTYMDQLNSKNYFGWVYITDGPGGPVTYNWLVTYYTDMVDYVKRVFNKN